MLTSILWTHVLYSHVSGKEGHSCVLVRKDSETLAAGCRACRISIRGDTPCLTVQGPEQPNIKWHCSKQQIGSTELQRSLPIQIMLQLLKPNPLNPVSAPTLQTWAVLFSNYGNVQFVQTAGSLPKPIHKVTQRWRNFFQKSIKNWLKIIIRIWSFCNHCLQYLHYFWLNRVQFSLRQVSSQLPEYLLNSHCKPFQSVNSSTALVQLVITFTVPLLHFTLCSRTPSNSLIQLFSYFMLRTDCFTYANDWDQAGFSYPKHEEMVEDYKVLITINIYMFISRAAG